jgi:hypothetical protein
VADGGQIALSLAQSAPYVSDLTRRESYLNLAKRFISWSEEFYIDSLKSAQLAISEPEEYKRGNAFAGMYGLGQYGNKRKLTGFSWVGADILALQTYLAYCDNNPDPEKFRLIADRNIRFYINAIYPATGYYQAEALCWTWLTSKCDSIRFKVEKILNATFIPNLLKGTENDMFEKGGRCALNALPLLYYQRNIKNDANIRAVLLKYVWTFGSESSGSAVGRLSSTFPKPVHGESLTAMKYAELSALWAMEILSPKSTLFLQ